jgi:drug/metabolite transporter (DMT)-like permease
VTASESAPAVEASPAASPAVSPRLALALAIAATSTGSLFVRLADAPPLAKAFWRCGLCAAVLALIGWRAVRADLARLGRRDLLLALASGLALALHFATWITSLSYTSVASSIVLVDTTPLWVALLTPLLSRDRLEPRLWIAVAFSVVGVAVVGVADLDFSGTALKGDALALAGAWMAALYLLAGRSLRPRLALVSYLVLCYGSAALILLALALANGDALYGYDGRTWLWLALLAWVPQLLGHSSYNYALAYLSAALVAVASLGEVFGAPLLAWIFLGERPPTLTVAGGALVLFGVVLAIRPARAPGA